MSSYLFIESRDPFEHKDAEQTWGLAKDLAGKGNQVSVFLVQNAVLSTRQGAACNTLEAADNITIYADDVSLGERGIAADKVRSGVQVASMETLVDLTMTDGVKAVWT